MSDLHTTQNADQVDCTKVILGGITAVVALIGIILLMGYIASSFAESQQNNQIIRPDPNAPPAPVVPILPSLVAELSRAKTICEGRASEAKEFIRRHRRVREREMLRGQQYYTNVQTELNGCIDYLRAGLVARFKHDDPAKISERFRIANHKMSEFVAWVDTLERPKFGTVDPLEAVRDMYPKWLETVKKANDEAINQLREDLDRCRLKSWQEVK